MLLKELQETITFENEIFSSFSSLLFREENSKVILFYAPNIDELNISAKAYVSLEFLNNEIFFLSAPKIKNLLKDNYNESFISSLLKILNETSFWLFDYCEVVFARENFRNNDMKTILDLLTFNIKFGDDKEKQKEKYKTFLYEIENLLNQPHSQAYYSSFILIRREKRIRKSKLFFSLELYRDFRVDRLF